jgi:hypothetical protein
MLKTPHVIEGTMLGQLGTEWNFSEEARKSHVQSVPLFYYRVVGFYLKGKVPAMVGDTTQQIYVIPKEQAGFHRNKMEAAGENEYGIAHHQR